jgi:outer membrane protein assembly factor BamA
VGEGDLRFLAASFRWDSRNDRDDPSTGWLLDARMEQGLEGTLRVYVPGFGPAPAPLVPVPVESEFTTVRLDATRYLRLGPRSRVALHALAAGSPDDGPLPPQRQHVLGGEGSLPAFERFAFDCGARADATPLVDGYFAHYGCDRMILLQAEYRFAFLTGESLGRRLGLDFDLVTTPELVLFGDAGRAWIDAGSEGYRTDRGPPVLRYDAGIGVRLGRLGVYLAVPLGGAGDRPNFFVRLGPRF